METLVRNSFPADWMTLVLISSLLALVLLKRFYYSRFLDFIILPFNNKYLLMYNKKERLFNWFNLLFIIFLVLNTALFIYFTRPLWQPAQQAYNPYLFLVIAGLLIAYLLVKMLLQLANAYLFNSRKIIIEYMFKKLSYFFYSGIVLFVANLVLAYVNPGAKIMIYCALTLFILLNAGGWLSILKTHQNYIASRFFYFILYLCALEIAPFVIILNVLTL